jgi:hypothetical protein
MTTNYGMTRDEALDFIDSYCRWDAAPDGAVERLLAAARAGLDLDLDHNQDAIDDVIYGPRITQE